MPTNRFRNYQALINLVPGTMPMSFGNAETDTPARSMTTNVNGQANTNNSTRTDGATNVNIWLPNHVMYVAPVETIDTVNVSTATFDAEQGMAGGAAITVVTKSGTNNFRGSAFEFFNNQDMNATSYTFTACSVNCNPESGKPNKLPVESNIYGATFGGPLRRDKLFFFGSFDGFRRSNSEFRFFNVPTAAMRAGDLSAATNNSRHAADHLQPVLDVGDRRHGPDRHSTATASRPACIDPLARKDSRAVSAAERPGHRSRRGDQQLSAARGPDVRARQL